MMPVFSGNYRSRSRQINLGGAGRQQKVAQGHDNTLLFASDKETILAQSQRERDLREEERRKHRAATAIRACWCAYKVRRYWQHQWLTDMLVLPLPLTATRWDVYRWMAKLLRVPRDSLVACHAAIPETQFADTLLHSLALPADARLTQEDMMLTLLRWWDSLSTDKPGRVRFARALFASPQFRSVFTPTRHFYRHIESTLVHHMAEVIRLATEKEGEDVVEATMWFTENLTHLSPQEVQDTLLSIACLPNKLPKKALTAFSRALTLDVLLVAPSVTDNSSDMARLSNLAAFGVPKVLRAAGTATAKDVLQRFLDCTIHCLTAVAPGVWSTDTPKEAEDIPMDEDTSSDEEDIPVLRKVAVQSSPLKSETVIDVEAETQAFFKTASVTVSSTWLTWFGQFTQPAFLHHLLHALTPGEDALTVSVAHFCLLLQDRLPALQANDIWTAILYAKMPGPSLFALLYTHLTNTPLFTLFSQQQYHPRLDAAYLLPVDGALPHVHVLVFLAEALQRYLVTCGDDEFFTSAMTMLGDPAPHWQSFILFLKNVSTTLYLHPLVGLPDAYRRLLFLLRNNAQSVLMQLHARNARRPFIQEDHVWLMQHAPSETVLQTDRVDAILTEYLESLLLIELPQYGHAPIATVNRALRRRHLVQMLPFLMPFAWRVKCFRMWVETDRREQNGVLAFPRGGLHRIRRDHMFEDGFRRFFSMGPELKARLQISFISRLGYEEDGIDGGGLFKEFLNGVCKEAFAEDVGLWERTGEGGAGQVYPRPGDFTETDTQLSQYQFVGQIIGKALYEGILVNVAFADFFLTKWLGRINYLDELASLDSELYRNLTFLKSCSAEEVEALEIPFSVASSEFGVTKEIPLVAGGEKQLVTALTRMRYIFLVANYKLNVQIRKQSNAFLKGLDCLIHPKWLRLFTVQELRALMCGTDDGIDVDDLEANTHYNEPYNRTTPVIVWFWEVVRSLTPSDQSALVKFVTSNEKPPMGGFEMLRPHFGIARGSLREPVQPLLTPADAEEDTPHPLGERLPTSSTCINLLKLPEYTDKETLREKLLYAIRSGAGFDMS